MPTVTLRYFAALRERRGLDAETLDVPAGLTLEALYRRLFPELASGGLVVGYAKNHAHAPGTAEVAHGDEVVFLPPLGGG